MSTTSKSPRKVLLAAHAAARGALPTYAHRCSPKVYTQHQLFACLVLKAFHKTDYRGIVAILEDSPSLGEAIGLQRVPHFTTLQKASKRLLTARRCRQLLDVTVAMAVRAKILPRRSRLAAIDSSGFEAHHTSHYFVKRRAKGGKRWQKTTYKRFPKLGVVCACRGHFILSAVTIRGPSPDITHLEEAAVEAVFRHRFGTLLADAGYDAEWAHQLLRLDLSVRSVIPPLIGRQTTKLPTGQYRRLMRTHFAKKTYGQRWQSETVFSMIKRRQGDALAARTYHSQNRAMRLMVLAHNIMILWRQLWGFLQSRTGCFSEPKLLAIRALWQ